jgi:50S ribosomal protein L16 3-hydroxylase
MYDQRHVFLNGEAFVAAGRDAHLMRRLADARALGGQDLARLSEQARAQLVEWIEAGWMHAE